VQIENVSKSETSPLTMPAIDDLDRVEQGDGGVTTITKPRKNDFAASYGYAFVSEALTSAGTYVAMEKETKLKVNRWRLVQLLVEQQG
jgi:hypothetical protein